MDLTYIERWLSDATVNYKDGRPAVGLGLIITVFFRNGHTAEVREKMVGCVDRFYEEFKPHLKKQMTTRWVDITEKNYNSYRHNFLFSSSEEIVDWSLSSANEKYIAPEYEIIVLAKRVFHNDNDRSVIKLAFPLSLLNSPEGIGKYLNWIQWLCNEFTVESGYGGLSFILPEEFHRMFPYEYALAQRFPGVIVDSLGTLEGHNATEGIKSACWYTILGNHWIDKIGGETALKCLISDTPEITRLPYDNGVILKAGEKPPALGEINTEELPPLLVKINQVIRPIRQDGHNGLHFYSMEENHQFDKESSMKWYARFDAASDKLPLPDMSLREPERLITSTDKTHTGGS